MRFYLPLQVKKGELGEWGCNLDGGLRGREGERWKTLVT